MSSPLAARVDRAGRQRRGHAVSPLDDLRVDDWDDMVAMSPDAVAFAVEQPDDVDVNEIVIRPTAQA